MGIYCGPADVYSPLYAELLTIFNEDREESSCYFYATRLNANEFHELYSAFFFTNLEIPINLVFKIHMEIST